MTATIGASGRPVVVTGGCGFIGANLADRLAGRGAQVVLVDTLARPEVERNLAWLGRRHGSRIRHEHVDVRDARALGRVLAGAERVWHCAAQVAVTTSLETPLEDFAVNAGGTLHLLEALRAQPDPPPVVFTSTNKVYGALDDVALRTTRTRYFPTDTALAAHGVGECRALQFHSPYGCSKGAADQYVLDFARSYGLRAVVFRMSCIFGPRQFGNEDQGWVAHFVRAALDGRPLTVYGDGRQVRDLLYIDDLIDALVLAQERVDELSGRAFNLGGGPERTLSLLELIAAMTEMLGRPPEVRFAEWRTGDQRWYVSDTRAFRAATGWRPRVEVADGLAALGRWLAAEVSRPADLNIDVDSMSGADAEATA